MQSIFSEFWVLNTWLEINIVTGSLLEYVPHVPQKLSCFSKKGGMEEKDLLCLMLWH